MRNLMTATALVLSGVAATSLFAGDGATAARPTAELGFAAIRKAATDKDAATLAKLLPTSLVKDWPEEGKDDGQVWRTAFAALIAKMTALTTVEGSDESEIRCVTESPDAGWDVRIRYTDGLWRVAAPWPYCIRDGELGRANGRKSAHVKLKARTDEKAYGPSAFSFVHVTQDPKRCLNRMDLSYCRCGQLHAIGDAMFSIVRGKKLDDLRGLHTRGDWQDELVPKRGDVYVLHVKTAGRADFQVAMEVTALSKNELEFDWRLLAAGKNAPASIHAAQPLVSNDGANGTAGICAERGK